MSDSVFRKEIRGNALPNWHRIALRVPGCLVMAAQAGFIGGCFFFDNTPAEPPDPEVTAVLVTALGQTTIRVDGTVDLDAKAVNSVGETVTTSYTWSSSDPAIATVVKTQTHNARVTATGVGQVTITATEGTSFVKGSITIIVQPPILTAIRVLPIDPSVLLGGSRALTAEAVKQSDGSVVSVPLVWSSSNTSIATVTWDPMSSFQAEVTGMAEGESTITAVEPSQPGVTGTTTVTVVGPQPFKGVLRGILYDKDDVTPLDSIYLSVGPVAGSSGSGAGGRTGRQTPFAVPPGGYEFKLDPGQYALFSVGVLGTRWLSTPGDTAFVFSNDTTELDLNVKRGYHLDMLGTDLGTIQAAAGSSINLVLSYQAWNRDRCPLCVPSLGIGVDGTPLTVYRFGTPGIFPGKSEQNISIPITVPAQGGTIYAMLVTTSTGSSIQPGLDQYASVWANNLQGSLFIRIGTLVVN